MYYCDDTKEVVKTYKEYLSTNHWLKVKTKMRKSKYEYRCYCCGKNKTLQLHHKTYKRVGKERLTDLIWLCADCHQKVHNKVNSGCDLWSASRKVRKQSK